MVEDLGPLGQDHLPWALVADRLVVLLSDLHKNDMFDKYLGKKEFSNSTRLSLFQELHALPLVHEHDLEIAADHLGHVVDEDDACVGDRVPVPVVDGDGAGAADDAEVDLRDVAVARVRDELLADDLAEEVLDGAAVLEVPDEGGQVVQAAQRKLE